MLERIKEAIEQHSFGVCSYIAEKIGVRSSRVRLYFIYASFATFGSPVILYLAGVFWLNIKKYLRRGEMIWNR